MSMEEGEAPSLLSVRLESKVLNASPNLTWQRGGTMVGFGIVMATYPPHFEKVTDFLISVGIHATAAVPVGLVFSTADDAPRVKYTTLPTPSITMPGSIIGARLWQPYCFTSQGA